MAFDFKKAEKSFYQPKAQPVLAELPAMQYMAVHGSGDPNAPGGAYQQAIQALYAVAYTIRMSYKTDHVIEHFFEYVVPPLESLWWREDGAPVDLQDKAGFHWTAMLRLPDFVMQADLAWAIATASRKKGLDCTAVTWLPLTEGLCVQMLHVGPYDTESGTIACMDAYLAAQGLENDWESGRRHHEIYLSDPRRTAPDKQRTVIRHPVRPQSRS